MSPIQTDRLQASLLREQVAGALRQGIVEMRLRPGERLVERELVQSTGVSRATVREALRQLAAEGLVTVIPQRGAVVAAPTPEEAANLYEIRAMLEGLAGRLFAKRASDRDVQLLRERFEDIERLVADSQGTADVLKAKNRFYEVLMRGANNATLDTVLTPLQARITVLRATSLSREGRSAAAVKEILAIVEAVEARDEEAAFRACAYHVTQAAQSALEALSSSGWAESATASWSDVVEPPEEAMLIGKPQ
jgi:DNA-binding GntR family transcriptional regulator